MEEGGDGVKDMGRRWRREEMVLKIRGEGGGGGRWCKRYNEKVDKGGDGIKDTHDPTAIILNFEENRNLGNFPDSHGRILKNSPDSKAFGKFTRFPGISGISEISEIPKGI